MIRAIYNKIKKNYTKLILKIIIFFRTIYIHLKTFNILNLERLPKSINKNIRDE
mgnify:CR=1 FL=1